MWIYRHHCIISGGSCGDLPCGILLAAKGISDLRLRLQDIHLHMTGRLPMLTDTKHEVTYSYSGMRGRGDELETYDYINGENVHNMRLGMWSCADSGMDWA